MSIFSSSAQLGERRGPASVAQTLYEETEASRAERQRLAAQLEMAPAAFVYEEKGRPTKKDRRDLSTSSIESDADRERVTAPT